ncbi:RNA binding motif protein 22 [Apophysomyces ossiformis]|uniref:Pre-mRNA-splicing factor RBM22 n=1 Tax=Apophysomyces ossiformis TaxID=679940 RepID=A0A8H7BIM3_9FUNG|nr:RNA binding motif protein 22 [Apophysomyces ossiformis]
MSLTKADPNKQQWEDASEAFLELTYRSADLSTTVHCVPLAAWHHALDVKSEAPTADINRQYYAQNMANKVEEGANVYDTSKISPANHETLKKLARTEPYYKRNRPHICSFFVKGECNRGDECPYRHEAPGEGDVGQQNIKNRYYGTNDPVAKKMLSRVKGNSLAPPEDKSVTSLFVTGVEEDIQEADIRGFFYAFGEIKSTVIIHRSKCAFVNFATRISAELAAEKVSDTGLTLNGHALRVTWGRPRPQGPKSDAKQRPASTGVMQPPAPPTMNAADESDRYPSQDPTLQGSSTKV